MHIESNISDPFLPRSTEEDPITLRVPAATTPENITVAPTTKFRFLPPFHDVKDLELFLSQLYRFWYNGGLVPIITSYVLHLLAVLFTIAFSWLLLLRIDWFYVLHSCQSDCQWSDILVHSDRNVTWIGRVIRIQSQLFLFALIVYFFGSLFIAWYNCWDAAALQVFVRCGLEIPSDEAMKSLKWTEFVLQLLQSQEKPEPNASREELLTALDVHHCIMRYDNYFLALVHHGVLFRGLPWWFPPRLLFTSFLNWSLRVTLFSHLLTSQRCLNRFLVDYPTALKRRFRWLGLISIVFMGPALSSALLLAVFKDAEGFRSDVKRPFERVLNAYADWTFTDYNELPHEYRKRTRRVMDAITQYFNILPRDFGVIVQLLRFLQYVLTSILGVMLLLTVVDDGPLLHVKIGNRYLLWYSLVLGACLTLVRNLNTRYPEVQLDAFSRKPASVAQELTQAAAQLFGALHTVPKSWRRLVTVDDANAFSLMFVAPRHTRLQNELRQQYISFRWTHVFEDALGILLSPLVFFVFLPRVAPDICVFVRRFTMVKRSIGAVCAFAELHISSLVAEDEKTQKSALHFVMSSVDQGLQPEPDLHTEMEQVLTTYQHWLDVIHAVARFQRDRLAELQDRAPRLFQALPAELKRPIIVMGNDRDDACHVDAVVFWFDEVPNVYVSVSGP